LLRFILQPVALSLSVSVAKLHNCCTPRN
jgi:hypothetical protein